MTLDEYLMPSPYEPTLPPRDKTQSGAHELPGPVTGPQKRVVQASGTHRAQRPARAWPSMVIVGLLIMVSGLLIAYVLYDLATMVAASTVPKASPAPMPEPVACEFATATLATLTSAHEAMP